jgi:Arc/MetJ-type ribon-helix-helix transcriptional regulator
MWTCESCGEAGNEDAYRFCYTCGAKNPAAEEAREGAPPPADDYFTEPADDAPPPREEQEHGFKLPKALTSLGQKLRHATAAAGGDHVISVRVSREAQEAVELLLEAGRFESQADAAGFLLEEGARSQAELLQLIRQKLSEIERLRAELRGIGERY